MARPPKDIQNLPWSRLDSHAWTLRAFRAPIIAFLDDFVETHNWAERWQVSEQFVDRGVVVSPTKPKQRPGARILRLMVIDKTRGVAGDRVYEVSLHFAQGTDTPTTSVERLLESARQTFEALRKEV